jgi:ketosteroid isomerase-like protein
VGFRDGRIDRQVDYWDGWHFTIAATQQLRGLTAQFPTEFGEDEVPEQASAVLQQVTAALSGALAAGDSAAAAALFASDATFEDLTLHTTMVGQQAIGGFLDRAAALLPYGRGTSVRHVVGTAQGGGYGWKNPGATVPNGIIALELDTQARISGLATVWDGSLVTDPALTTTLQATIEH